MSRRATHGLVIAGALAAARPAAAATIQDAAGVRRATHTATVPAHGLLVLNTATVHGWHRPR
jgi:hypothetical protein